MSFHPHLRARRILEGVRILDLTSVLSGPFATFHLALLGAEVIKIENPVEGDLARKLGAVAKLNQDLMGTSFLAQNANKKSMTLNLKDPQGREIFKKLIPTAHVVMENFRPDVMTRLGLSYKVLSDLNPQLIYCAISGFGQSGPDAFKPAYDQIIQGLSGVMAVTGDETLNPLRCGFPVCDTVGGLNAAFATLAALFHRQRTGEGQFIDVALIDSILPMLGWAVADLLIGKQPPVPMGNDNFTAAPSGTFKTKDGHINITANKQEQWETVADLLGLSNLKSDPRFRDREGRKKNREALTSSLQAKLEEKPTAFWVDLLNKNDVPAGAVLSLQDALNQEQIRHRHTLQKLCVPGIGEVRVFGLTPKFVRTPASIDSPPPRLSQHTFEILQQLGYTDQQIKEFKQARVI